METTLFTGEACVLWSCDSNYSDDSKKLKGIFTDETALDAFLSDMEIAGEIDPEDFAAIKQYNHTRGKDLNFLIETEILNPAYEDVCSREVN